MEKWRLKILHMMSYNYNQPFFNIRGFGTILVEIIKINLATSENIFDTGFAIIRKFHRYIIHFRIWQQYSDIAIGATR